MRKLILIDDKLHLNIRGASPGRCANSNRIQIDIPYNPRCRLKRHPGDDIFSTRRLRSTEHPNKKTNFKTAFVFTVVFKDRFTREHVRTRKRYLTLTHFEKAYGRRRVFRRRVSSD